MIVVVADGTLSVDNVVFSCALGSSGIGKKLTEGDGLTPVGTFPLRMVHYRADRISRPETMLETRAIEEIDGWCDDPGHPAYNSQIVFPFDASAEHLWRQDHLYDVVVELGFNDHPVVPGRGSAIFIHVARPDYGSTEGCIALALNDLLVVLKKCRPGSTIQIGADTGCDPNEAGEGQK